MGAPDRGVVDDALRVVPHPVRVDHPTAGPLGDAQHQPVGRIGYPGQQLHGRLAVPTRPVLPDKIMIGADTAGRDDDRPGADREIVDHVSRRALPAGGGGRFQHLAGHSGDAPAVADEFGHPVAESELYAAGPDMLGDPAHEWGQQPWPGSPGEVEPRYGVAMLACLVAAALGPLHDREECDTFLAEPGPLLARRESQVGLGPQPGPVIFGPVEPGGPEPVRCRKFRRVLDAEPALLRRVHQEKPAERPPGLAAETGRTLLVDDDHRPPGVRRLGRGDQPGQPRSDHNDVRLRHALTLSHRAAADMPTTRSSERPTVSPPIRHRKTAFTGRQWGRMIPWTCRYHGELSVAHEIIPSGEMPVCLPPVAFLAVTPGGRKTHAVHQRGSLQTSAGDPAAIPAAVLVRRCDRGDGVCRPAVDLSLIHI